MWGPGVSTEPGQTLSHYRLVEKIGEGGMGAVWKAVDTTLDREVAIKMLPPAVADRPDRLERFEREAKLTGALNHPNIVAIYELGQHEGAPYIVMELVPGETLREKARGTLPSSVGSVSGPSEGGASLSVASSPRSVLPPRKAIEYVVQIAHGLAAAHEKGVCHRDLKPENILITPAGQAKILDFGLAKLAAGETDEQTPTRTAGDVTAPGAVMGSVGYMSPEQVRGQAVDHRADIFALGAILYELLSGRRAFQAGSSVETMNAVLTQDPPVLSGEHTRISSVLERIVRRCLEKEPGERFQSGHDLAFALQAVGDTTSAEREPIPLAAAPGKRVGRTVLALAAVVAIAALAFLAGRLLSPGGPEALSGDGPMRLARLTFERGVERQPSVSPDGNSFVHVSDGDIYLRRVGGETSICLTADFDGRDWMPAFSPDGERIAFRSSRGGGGIFTMGATGESVRRLTDFGFNPSWSPDGRSVLVTGEEIPGPSGRASRSQLWRVDVATGERVRLTREGDDVVQARFSPNGGRIAYWGLPEGSGKRVLYTMPAAGGEPVALTDDDAINWNPVWSPDGRFLYFVSDRSGTMNLWRLPIDESTGRRRGPPQPVTVSAVAIRMFDVAASTGRIVFASGSSSVAQERVAFDAGRVKISGEPEVLLDSFIGVVYEAPSPDGRWVAFTGMTSQEDLYLLDIEHKSLRRLTSDVHKDRGAEWTPDSERIYFYSDRGGRYDIWSIRPDGSGIEQVTDISEGTIHSPRISPDGRRAVANTFRGCVFLDLTGPRPTRQLEPVPPVEEDLHFECGSWSPDGSRIAGVLAPSNQGRSPGVWVYALETGSYRKLADEGLEPMWLDDSTVAYMSPDGRLTAVDTETGDSRTSEPLTTGTIDRPTLSADRRWLYYSRWRSEGDIWMLDL
jgi:Tol biopolymer transport system component/tRNA A-37 threonylcarbamoyl transferase component Bud32